MDSTKNTETFELKHRTSGLDLPWSAEMAKDGETHPLFGDDTDYVPSCYIIDGVQYKVDPDTGELTPDEPFFIDTDEKADWLLEKIVNAQADKARALTKLNALRANLEADIKAAERRERSLLSYFGPQLAEHAKKKLDGKTKTVRFTWGSVAFRTVKGGLRVVDADKALLWAKSNGHSNAVKVTESFQVSLLSDAQRECAAKSDAFEVKPDTEVFDIKTGVNA